MIKMSPYLDGGSPFLLKSGRLGCILVHGFTSMPEETRPLAEYLADKGITCLGVRLAGHGTHPSDLARTHWSDWLHNLEDAVTFLSSITDHTFLIGQSMGGILSLVFSSVHSISGVVAVSTPALPVSKSIPFGYRFQKIFFPTVFKDSSNKKHDKSILRESNYPAYAFYPSSIHQEVHQLQQILTESLPAIKTPALVIQSRDDPWIPLTSAEFIISRINSDIKHIHWMENSGHSILLGKEKVIVFENILSFIHEIAT